MTAKGCLHFLEIGDKPFIKTAFPAETHFFSTYRIAPATNAGQKTYNISLSTIGLLRTLISSPSTSLIVCHPTFSSPWSLRALLRAIGSWRLLRGDFPVLRAFGPQFLRGYHSAPLVVLDQDDYPLIDRSNLFLLEDCDLYFKRELPADRWKVFMKTAHAHLPTSRFRRQDRWASLIKKLRPISMGLPLDCPTVFPTAEAKLSDVFFVGRTAASSWIRIVGMRELSFLRDQGLTVDASEERLSRDEFYARCARSWLTWSPEGYGWECFRHYEALACGSVPLINLPSIERYQPFIAGQHALFYSGEQGSLGDAILDALSDKPRLERIASAGRAHVLARHTASALAQHIVEEGLSRDRRG